MNEEFMKYQTCSSSKGTHYSKYQFPMQTRSSYSFENVYTTKLPSNIDIFSKLSENVNSLTNESVKKQILHILGTISHILQEIVMYNNNISNYLSRMNIVEQNDFSALIEWNFHKFRLGFLIETDETESSYYIISEDKSTGSFIAETKKVGTDIDIVTAKIVEYVLKNT